MRDIAGWVLYYYIIYPHLPSPKVGRMTSLPLSHVLSINPALECRTILNVLN